MAIDTHCTQPKKKESEFDRSECKYTSVRKDVVKRCVGEVMFPQAGVMIF